MDGRRGGIHWLRKSWKWLLLVVLVGGGVYYLRFRPVKVELHTVASGPVRREVMGTGTLEARVAVTVSPEIASRITSIGVDQGDPIDKGQVLVTLDDSDLRQQVAIAAAALEESKAGLERTHADVVRAEAVVTQARKDHERVADLTKRQVETQAELDRVRERLDIAQAELARARVAVVEAESRIVSAERNLEYHDARLTDTRIASPFDGLVVARRREPGDVVVPGTPILDIVDTGELWVSAWVDESATGEVRPGQPARVVFRSDPRVSLAGEVVRLAPSVDRESREFLVDVRIGKLPKRWAIGQRAEVFILTAEKPHVTSLPTRLVAHRDGRPGAMVVVGGRARWRELTPGLRGATAVEVLDGLLPGQEIVAPDVREGARIAR
jgi:RND family efflux transporter MFP subunit